MGECFKLFEFLSASGLIESPSIVGLKDQNTIQVNLSGATSIDIELQESVDGVNWATSVDITGSRVELTGQSDAQQPFLFHAQLGKPRYYRLVFSNIVGSPNIEVWKS